MVNAVSSGTTLTTVSDTRSSMSSLNKMTMIVTIETSWTAKELMPSWRNCWRFSMSRSCGS